MDQADLAARLRAMFVEELDEQVQTANEHLLALERAPDDGEQLRSLFRVMHTLKGAARSADVLAVERLCHRMEAMLAAARDESRALTRAELELLFAGVDRLAVAQGILQRGDPVSDADVDLTAGGSGSASARPLSESSSLATSARVREPAADMPLPAAADGNTSEPDQADALLESTIRVGQGRVDALFGITNRLLILAAGLKDQPAEVEAMHDASLRAAAAWRRIRRDLPTMVGDSRKHLARDLETVDDAIMELRKRTGGMLGETLQNGRELHLLASEASLGVRDLRMRPFADAVADLPRVVRDVAAATDKRVELEISGENVQADRAVLSQIHDALVHLVRNAVDHGIEAPEQRLRLKKPEQGTIRVSASLIGDRIVVSVQDDGAGLDIAAMRRELAARGEGVPPIDRDVARRLFLGGLSTRGTATAISGRGVGLDVVRAVAERVRGSVDVSWVAGGGTTFTLEAPLTLATVRAVLARAGSTRVAIPSAFVERLVLVAPEALRTVEGRMALQTGDAPATVASLAAILGPPLVDRPPEGRWSLVLLRVGGRQVAIRVDELLEELEVVVRPIRAHGRLAVPHVSGAAMLAGGTVALVLNAPAVVATALGLPVEISAVTTPGEEATLARRRVLVVDDSITTRTLEASVLEAAGYDVVTAVDGADGWRTLQERGADLVVSDVEMPRMDGLQLCQTIRSSTRFKTLPVVLVTALETPEHRAQGLEVGADAYLGKSSFEQDALLTTVRDLLG